MGSQRGSGRPSALKHGLTSKRAREEASEEIDALVRAILGPRPPAPPLRRAAVAAADAIVQLRRVRRARQSLLDEQSRRLARDGSDWTELMSRLAAEAFMLPEEARRHLRFRLSLALPAEEASGQEQGAVAMLDSLVRQSAALERLAVYERRALSQRRKALRYLDYERIEAARRAGGSRAEGSPAAGGKRGSLHGESCALRGPSEH